MGSVLNILGQYKNIKVISIFLIGLGVFSSTWDLLAINWKGVNLKISYFFLMTCFLLNFKDLFFESKKTLRKINKSFYLLLFVSILITFIKTSLISNFIAWWGWFFFNIVVVIYFSTLKIESNRVLGILCFGLALNVLLGIVQYIGFKFFNLEWLISQYHYYDHTPRLSGLSYYPNFYSISLSLYIAFLIEFRVSKFIFNFTVLAGTFLVSMTTAKSGQLGIILMLLISIFFRRDRISRKLLLGVCVSFIFGFLFYSNVNQSQYGEVKNLYSDFVAPSGEGSVSERAYIFIQGLKVFGDHPFSGVGLREYSSVMQGVSKNQKLKYLSGPSGKKFFYHFENAWEEVLVEGGVFLFSLLFIAIFKLLLTKRDNKGMVSVFLYFFFLSHFVQNINYLLPFVLLGFALNKFVQENESCEFVLT